MSLRLISFLILLGTMPVCSVYAQQTQCDHNNHDDNGFCQVENCELPYKKPFLDTDNYYKIENAGNLYWFAARVNEGNKSYNAKLMNDIVVNTDVLNENGDLNEGTFRDWTPIGNSTNSYLGSFDGQGHTVSGLYYNETDTYYVGLFGHIGDYGSNNNTVTEAHINNVGVIDSYFKGNNSYIAGIVGCVEYGSITNCYNTSYIDGFQYVGGIVGYLDRGSILNCYNSGSIIGTQNTGAVVGCNVVEYGSVTNCYYLKEEGNSGIYGIGGTDSDGTHTVAKTNAQFASGEVAYKLQGEQTTPVWGQNIDNGQEREYYPVLSDAKVYEVTCEDNDSHTAYSNTNSTGHAYVNGICACGAYQPATDSDEDDYYEIANAGNLYWFAALVNGDQEIIGENAQAQPSANAKLMNDIVVNTNVLNENGELNEGTFRPWTPIGNSTNSYLGSFDGQGHTVSGLYYNATGSNYVGLFGRIGFHDNSDKEIEAAINNVGVIDSYFKIIESSASDEGQYIGGIVGRVEYGRITNCYNTSYIDGYKYVGGIVGWLNKGSILNCYNTGSVKVSSYYAGGIVGYTKRNTNQILNCYSTGSISGSDDENGINIGGIAGSNGGTILNCYSTASISGRAGLGGIVGGDATEGTVSNCYYLKENDINSGIYGIGETHSDDTRTVAKTNAKFASGQVAWLLNGSTAIEVVWGQNIDNGQERQYYPVLGGATVIAVQSNCSLGYHCSNNINGVEAGEYDDGICNVCGAYQPAELNNNETEDDETDDYYEIDNTGNLYWFAALVNGTLDDVSQNPSANAELTANITINKNVLVEGDLNSDVSGFRSWTPIGYMYTDYDKVSYQGNFDGNNNTISGLYYGNNATDNVGLFGHVSGSVQNVGVIDSYFNAKDNVGTIVGRLGGDGLVSNCYNTGVCQGNMYVGGVVGMNSGKITNSYNKGSVKGSSFCGGVVGPHGGEITNCYNAGNIIISSNGESRRGGVVAYTLSHSIVSNCYYLDGTATNGIGGDGGVQSQEGMVVVKTSEQFASGEVAYLLQDNQETQVWGQNIDNVSDIEKQDYPVLSAARVYRTGVEGSYDYTNKFAWSYEDCILTIYGAGLIPGYEQDQVKPWEEYLDAINTVVVKAGITGIGDYAFSDVIEGAKIFFYRTTAPTLGANVFPDVNNNTYSIFVPSTSLSSYKPSTKTNWSSYSSKIEGMPTYTSDGWQMPTASESTEQPTSTDHVVIDGALVLGQQSTSSKTTDNNNVLTVSSFGLTENGSITIKAGEQKVNDELIDYGGQLICQQAHGEVTVEKTIYSPSLYTISSPLKGSVYATSVTNLIDRMLTKYTLYRYDETNHRWENYKNAANKFTTLDAGRGYLYSIPSNITTLEFTGEINTADVTYELTASDNTLSGIHLIGNPFTHNITAANNFSVSEGVELAAGYYVLSNQGSWDVQTNYFGNEVKIKPGQGILIKTNAAGTLTIKPNEITNVGKGQEPRAKSQQPMLSLNVSNGNYSDRAFVIFGKGIGLDKINHQNEDIPVLYIPMSDADYAIAMMDESVNEIPVGFESSSMGEFTISLRQENCEFEELYLLDKETGAKVNILEQDYTFMATSGDNPDRFILVKSQGSQPEAQSNFAYINNGDVVIYGIEGNAHIDIYDVLGRHVYNANGRDDVHIVNTDGYSAGVYVIRLMDEKGLRTQKVIID